MWRYSIWPRSPSRPIPPVAGSDLKLCAPDHKRRGDPERDAALDEKDEPAIRAFFRASLPDIDDYRLLYLKTCFYTTAADARLTISRKTPSWSWSAASTATDPGP